MCGFQVVPGGESDLDVWEHHEPGAEGLEGLRRQQSISEDDRPFPRAARDAFTGCSSQRLTRVEPVNLALYVDAAHELGEDEQAVGVGGVFETLELLRGHSSALEGLGRPRQRHGPSRLGQRLCVWAEGAVCIESAEELGDHRAAPSARL
ncbi:hypothetical protein PPSIR1_38661 [Plesiocystis pacifica SIR-1]|uniref:Uncharacterized protein n=1 Tax=Plesiocystis pacifica SIR-1 TaxID=391625 RepID=A6G8Q5_9BACT|nr:hypothetical protein PPSIR1_38661 [Plesiocystis pacifica SIR-1]